MKKIMYREQHQQDDPNGENTTASTATQEAPAGEALVNSAEA